MHIILRQRTNEDQYSHLPCKIAARCCRFLKTPKSTPATELNFTAHHLFSLIPYARLTHLLTKHLKEIQLQYVFLHLPSLRSLIVSSKPLQQRITFRKPPLFNRWKRALKMSLQTATGSNYAGLLLKLKCHYVDMQP